MSCRARGRPIARHQKSREGSPAVAVSRKKLEKAVGFFRPKRNPVSVGK